MDEIVYNHKRQVWLEEIAYRLYRLECLQGGLAPSRDILSKPAYVASVNKGVGEGEGKA